MMDVMESPGGFPESPMDQDDVVYPCKGCGNILEEGKAFELAGNRWHIDCFRCNTCGTLLDSDANLLLLGDGSLICNNCTYSCNVCGNKIEDLAILTGDQAFCASCFRCRNCKRKIENLRYARTSQGIFCMSCHESLMARRRKKSKARQQTPTSNGTAPVILDKSLPALPPNAVPQSVFTPDAETPPSEMDVDPSPRPRGGKSRRDPSLSNNKREPSPEDDANKDNLTLPASTYKQNRSSEIYQPSGDDGFVVPFALDPNPAPDPSPMAKDRGFNDNTNEPTSTQSSDRKGQSRDYFTRPTARSAHRDALKEKQGSSSPSRERQKDTTASPHIAYQEKGRHTSNDVVESTRKRKDQSASASATASPAVHEKIRPQQSTTSSAAATPSNQTEGFKLQEAPKSRKTSSRRNSKSEARSPVAGSPATDLMGRTKSPPVDRALTSSPPSFEPEHSRTSSSQDQRINEESPTSQLSGSSYSSVQKMERPKRGDSLAASKQNAAAAAAASRSSPSTPTAPFHERKPSGSSALANRDVNGGWKISKPYESPTAKSMLDPPLRSAARPGPPGTTPSADTFTQPRPPPPPPLPTDRHKPNESISSMQSEATQPLSSPVGLPRYSAGGDFSLDEDMARILRGEEGGDKESGVLRRVSNAVSKHGRSFSDRGSRSSQSQRHWRSPLNGSIDISSPTSVSPDTKEDVVNMRNQLRWANQRIAELEAEKNGLQDKVNSSADIKQVNTELREKRSTIAVLDTQRDMVVRELEIMTDHLAKAKESNQPLDINQLKSEILKDFAASLQKLKDNLGGQIEELMTKKNDLTEEISSLIQMKDKGFQEYESLSTKNAQLQELNNQLVHNIQDMYRANRQPNGSFDGGRPPPQGLGIYTPHHQQGTSDISVDMRHVGENSMASLLGTDDQDATIVAAPKVVDIRKIKDKPRGFNWKKGGQTMTKNITKGLKGAFATQPREGQEYTLEGRPYGSITSSDGSSTIGAPRPINDSSRNDRGGFGFFGGNAQRGNTLKSNQLRNMQNNSSSNLHADAQAGLFGSELKDRCAIEGSSIPAIVSRCIQEVELRGMDAEGIYRKSGGTGQVNQIKAGFERSGEHDISDPDLDIHAVTSCLKQYFRKLPTPLISFDAYDQLLASGQIQDPEKRSIAMRNGVQALPECHRDCLQFLIFHLGRVIQHESVNLMTPLNLAVVFAPTIMRPPTVERELLDMQAQRKTVQAMIENHESIFVRTSPYQGSNEHPTQ